jgi:hypothetical protein
VLSPAGQAATVLLAVEEAMLEVLEAVTFALVPEAVTKPEAEEMEEEETEDELEDEPAALLPRLTREPESTLLLADTGLPN